MKTENPVQEHIDREADVLVVGAGPVGLATAIELGRRGVKTLVIEQEARSRMSPRAKTTNVRTLTHFRRWGIADKLREASPLPGDYPSDVVFATRLNGHKLAHFENVNYCDRPLEDYFPETAQWIPQYHVEDVMRKYIETLDTVQLVFGLRLDDAIQDEHGVTAFVCDTATEKAETIKCGYLVGADGARTTVRNTVLKIPMQGDHAYNWNYTVVFRSRNIQRKITVGRAIMYWLVNTDVPCICGPMDRDDLWFFMATAVDAKQGLPEDPAGEILRSTGLDLDIAIERVEPWAVHRLIAERYREKRIFLVGDACHLHPPMGGYGMNMGIGDAVDLGWKLAAVLQGWGGERLLESYEMERRPVHEKVIFQAVQNYALLGNQLTRDSLEANTLQGEQVRLEAGKKIIDHKSAEFYTLGVVLGDCYAESPVVQHERNARSGINIADVGVPGDYLPSSVPGCLAPHVWVADDVSLYDLLGPGMTLICRPGKDESCAQDVAKDVRSAGISLAVVGSDHPMVLERYPAAFTLVRPDQFVAWRGSNCADIKPALIASLGFS